MVTISKASRIGWIGTGVMGRYMCEHLINNGYKNMTVFNRTKAKALPLEKLGAQVVDSAKEVAQQSDVVFTIVGYPADVESTYLDADNGILHHLKAGSVVIDMTTSKPSLASQIASVCQEKGIFAVDAPVSGGDVGARDATLSIMAGGEQEVVSQLDPLFKAMGKNVTYCGAAGFGQHTKMVNQILISTMMVGLVEALIYGHKAGLDLNTVIQAVGSGAAGSWSLTNYGPRMLRRDFQPGFYVEHFIKDLEIALDEARRLDLSLPGLAVAHQLYRALKAQGHGRLGTQSLQLALEQMNNIEIKKYD
ncbi:hypothetical protein MP228_006601 [Amoeboaphelidium protococcarum]|nr:hypothetical protein MP228_006601 [Amoeboaphelidium protococcarum]